MATVWIRAGLIAWLKGVPDTRRADTPLRGTPEDDDEPLYDQQALDDAVAQEREACAQIVDAPHWKTVVRNECRARAEAIRSRSNSN